MFVIIKLHNMKKISTLFKKDPNDLGRVINEINPDNEWVLTNGIATRKFDGTAMAIINGELYKRYDVKKGKSVPEGAIPCQEPDSITGHWPHWVKVDFNDKSNWQAKEAWGIQYGELEGGTYELCGPKIQGNPEKFDVHTLVKHGEWELYFNTSTSHVFEYTKAILTASDIEGIVFHANDGSGRMCKIRKSDFGIKRTTN